MINSSQHQKLTSAHSLSVLKLKSVYTISLADLRWAPGTRPSPPPRVQILSISCSFGGKYGQIIAFHLHFRSWRTPLGKSRIRRCICISLFKLFKTILTFKLHTLQGNKFVNAVETACFYVFIYFIISHLRGMRTRLVLVPLRQQRLSVAS